jgi:hypothetical protein
VGGVPKDSRVPLEGVHGHVVAGVCHEVLATVGLGALVNATLLRTHNKQVLTAGVEIEAAATSQACIQTTTSHSHSTHMILSMQREKSSPSAVHTPAGSLHTQLASWLHTHP